MFRRLVISLIAFTVAAQAYGQHRLSAGVRSGYPFSPVEELLEGANSLGRPLNHSASADFQYAFIIPQSSWQGIGLSVFSLFDHEDVGTPVSLYVFQGAEIARLSPAVSLDYEWNFGASFGWHRNKEYPLNTIMGTKVNAYVNGSIMLSWQPSGNWRISAGPDMTHYSNGHTALPNAGLNVIGLRMNAARIFGAENAPGHIVRQDEDRHAGTITCDVTAFGAWKKYVAEYDGFNYISEGAFGTMGLHINPFCDIHRHFRLGMSMDLNYDESANLRDHVAGFTQDEKIRFFRPPLNEQISLGLSVRAELVMPIFSVHFGVGHNLIYKGDELDGFYQIIALKTHVSKRVYLHTGYQFWDFLYPDHLLLGLGLRLGKI